MRYEIRDGKMYFLGDYGTSELSGLIKTVNSGGWKPLKSHRGISISRKLKKMNKPQELTQAQLKEKLQQLQAQYEKKRQEYLDLLKKRQEMGLAGFDTTELDFKIAECEYELQGLFKKIKKIAKKAVKAVGKGVGAVAKGATNVVKGTVNIAKSVVKKPLKIIDPATYTKLLVQPTKLLGINIDKSAEKIGRIGGVAVGTYFGLPFIMGTVVPALGSVGSTLVAKLGATKTGMWWAKAGTTIYRVFKGEDGQIITQQVDPNSDLAKQLADLPDGITSQSEADVKTSDNPSANQAVKNTPLPLPSGMSEKDLSNVTDKAGTPVLPLKDEYAEGKQVVVDEKGNVKTTSPLTSALPIVAGALLLMS
ncbi:MAG: hypothetical protein GYA62_04170 [Bacteroidales bacterium]|nr:hypothetical protein [Bacteroidales bacterium]